MRRWNADMEEFEKHCNKCGSWWPMTSEFWWRKHKRGVVYYCGPCKSCVVEKRTATNAVTPCCVPGCDEPRHDWYASRCTQHQRELNHARWLRGQQRQAARR